MKTADYVHAVAQCPRVWFHGQRAYLVRRQGDRVAVLPEPVLRDHYAVSYLAGDSTPDRLHGLVLAHRRDVFRDRAGQPID